MAFQRHFLTVPPYCSLGQRRRACKGPLSCLGHSQQYTFSPVSTFLFHLGREAEMAHQLDRQPCPWSLGAAS